MADIDRRTIARGLCGARIAVGAAAMLAPSVAGRVFGFPQRDMNASTLLVSRLFAVREMAVGCASMVALAGGTDEARLYRWNAAVDGGDIAAALVTAVTSRKVTLAMVGTALTATTFTVAWLKLAADA